MVKAWRGGAWMGEGGAMAERKKKAKPQTALAFSLSLKHKAKNTERKKK
jgi:hypothetical protein